MAGQKTATPAKKPAASDMNLERVVTLAAQAAVKALRPEIQQIAAGVEQQGLAIADLMEQQNVINEAAIEAASIPPQFLKKKEEEPDGDEGAAVAASDDEEEEVEELDDADELEAGEEEMDAATDDGNLADMGPDTADPGDTKPGHLADGHDVNHGTSGGDNKKVGKTVSKPVTGSSAKDLKIRILERRLAASAQEIKQLKARMGKLGKQVSAAAEKVTRKSVSPNLVGLLAKSEINVNDLQASGTKLSVADVDAAFAACGVQLDATARMAFKNELVKAGLMDEGRVNRGVSFERR